MDTNRMERIDSVLLTPTGNKVHLHARDYSRSVRLNRLISENELTFAHYPVLSLSIADEAGLVLWSEEVYAYAFRRNLTKPGLKARLRYGKARPSASKPTGKRLIFQFGCTTR